MSRPSGPAKQCFGQIDEAVEILKRAIMALNAKPNQLANVKYCSKFLGLLESCKKMVSFSVVKVEVPKDCNVILGMAHFIKTVEDLYEALKGSVPDVEFGVGFCESSGPCLVRREGNDEELEGLASKYALELGAGHCFIVFLRNAYPINVLEKIKQVPEVCCIYAATANPLEVIIVETEQGRGIVAVVDGFKSKGIETEADVEIRREFLRKIGYKL